MALKIFNSLLGKPLPIKGVPLSTQSQPVSSPKKEAKVPYSSAVSIRTFLAKFNVRDYITSLITFNPSQKVYRTPLDKGINHEEVYINTPDGEKLHGYFFPAKEKTDKVILYLHGNDENVGLWHEALLNIQEHVPANGLIVDYRGYGKSTGISAPRGVITDVLSMYDHLIERGYKPENISIYGRSLGGAIGLELATRVPVRSVVIQSSILSLRDIKKVHMPHLPSFLVRGDFLNSKELIQKIKVPILISHGTRDKRVPLEQALKLYDLANEPKKLIILNGAGHDHLKAYYIPEYFIALREMIL